MKLVALVGSLRKKSYNRSVFEAYKGVAGERALWIEGKYDDFPLYNSDLHEESFPSPVSLLGEQIASADGIIFFSPEYNYSLPGALKNAIDWVSRLKDQPFAGKPAAIIGASPGKLGTARMQYHLRQMAVFLDLLVLNKPEVMISQVHGLVDGNNRFTDETTLKYLAAHFEKFASFVAANR